jgi:hypothetical protein
VCGAELVEHHFKRKECSLLHAATVLLEKKRGDAAAQG